MTISLSDVIVVQGDKSSELRKVNEGGQERMSRFERKALTMWAVMMTLRCVLGVINRVAGV